ncbi:MAG: DUF4405 domain-containing protein [Bacteroidales bacterium]|nr:DUF4405 domain-containing protein [Bacteroidales bacterium]
MKLTGNSKSRLNLSIDIVMFILLLAMAGIGFLMKYVVVSGERRNELYGNHVDLEFLGLTRHQWGSIHLSVSILFLVLIILHIILHWKCIVSIYKCMFPSLFLQYSIVVFLCLFTILTLISPFILEPERVPFEPLYRNRQFIPSSENSLPATLEEPANNEGQPARADGKLSDSDNNKNKDVVTIEEHQNSEYDEYEVYGSNTLQYVADRYNVPSSVICSAIGVPEDKAGERLGQLRRRYSFTMTDIRKSISDFKNINK